YLKYHLSGMKRDFNYRLTSLDRAMEAGIDDVGLGALFGLGDWRFEVMGLVRHTNHLEAVYGVGPHTISFPRITPAKESDTSLMQPVSDSDLLRIITILRLAVPYTGLIMTAREGHNLRHAILQYGVSQIDGGTNINIGGYTEEEHKRDKEQFTINDDRPLNEVIDDLVESGFLPSFCTACYRKGRTGEHFMEFSVPGFIKRFCTPNAILTLAEYLEDYASPEIKTKGYDIIERHIGEMDAELQASCREKIKRITNGERDLLY
ncbi:MAG: [FeFe] hydrogenase H-cluster radical SAM maturase HydG, partial [Rikenellaceae bacterium]